MSGSVFKAPVDCLMRRESKHETPSAVSFLPRIVDEIFPALHLSLCNRRSAHLDRKLKHLVFSGKLSEAVALLFRQGSSGVVPETHALLLQECINRKDLRLGRRVHAHMVAVGASSNHPPDDDVYLRVKLLILYAKAGDLRTARLLFDGMPKEGATAAVPWNAMISGYARSDGLKEEGLRLFRAMRSFGVTPDQFTFASVLRVCAGMAKLEHGKLVHGTVVKLPAKQNVVVSSALVDMYFKCSCPGDGRRAFEESAERNVLTWTALISGYGQHGEVAEAINLFTRMVGEGFRPNYVTFLAVISGCGHAGLVSEGWKYFNSMKEDFGIEPRGEHVASMVDLLGRAGKLDEAYEFIQRYPHQQKQHPAIWGALLGACRIHGDVRLSSIAADRFFELDPGNAGKRVVVSNTLAASEMWKDVSSVRETARGLGIVKEPGWSAVDSIRC